MKRHASQSIEFTSNFFSDCSVNTVDSPIGPDYIHVSDAAATRQEFNETQISQIHSRDSIVRAHQTTKTNQRAQAARCVVLRSFAKGISLPMSLRSSASVCPWSTGNGYEDESQPGEVGA